MIYSSLNLPFPYVPGRTIQLAPPPAVISLNHRKNQLSKRMFSPEGFDRLHSLLQAAAYEYNFDVRVVVFEDKSFAEQVRLMQSTGIVVGVHGANLMNAIFIPPLGSILEVFPRYYSVRLRRH